MSETYTEGGDTYFDLNYPTRVGQTFRPRETHTLGYIDLEVYGGDLYSAIPVRLYYAGIDHKPFGPILSAGTIANPGPEGFHKLIRTRCKMTPYLLSEGQYYCLVALSMTLPPSSQHHLQYDKDDATYPRGMRVSSADNGATWTVHFNDDLIFCEFGTPPLPKPDPPPPVAHFALTDLSKFHLPNAILFYLSSNVPCHLTCYFTSLQPWKHHTTAIVRGLAVPWDTYYCFVSWNSVEQQEEGDTLYHTFEVPDWQYCQTKWFAFRGTIAGELSPSVSPIFTHHHPGVTHLIEEQTLYNQDIIIAGFIRSWAGQRLTIPLRRVSKLAFVLHKFGTPTGDVTFQIRRVSDDSIIMEKVWGSAADLQPVGSEQWEEVEFDTPTLINEEIRLVVYYPADLENFRVELHYQNTDVKSDEYLTYRMNDSWTPVVVYDAAYRYTYLT